MTAGATDQWGRRRIAHRSADGIEVSLVSNKPTRRLTVEVYDTTTRRGFELDVAGADALEAFHRPYAYAASRRGGSVRTIETNVWRWKLADAA